MADPMEVHVQVFVHPGGPNGDFHFESSDLPMGPDNFLYFRNCCHPGFYVHYELQGGSYVFPDANMTKDYKKEALYSQQQPGCPSSEGQWGQFTTEDVVAGGGTLIVWNKNQSKQDFGYTLRVTNDGGKNYLPLDPGGGNQNGPLTRFSAALVLVAGAVAGALVALGAQALLAR